MDNKFINSFNYKVIYIFEIQDEKHRGLLKIGDSTLKTSTEISRLSPNCRELNQAAIKRIRSYTNTAGIEPKLLYTELAICMIKNKSTGLPELKAFRDYDVHKVLKNSGINNRELVGSTSKEWFEIDLNTAIAAIQAVKDNVANLNYTDKVKFTPIIFRPEQLEAISKTVKQFKKGNRMLWNAKMRFGKTICALKVIQEMKFRKTIIVTHRPVVNDGWYEDFKKIFQGNKDYVYSSKSNGYTIEQLINSDKKFVYFASIQDLRGSIKVGGKFDKNNTIFNIDWDCVIVDEAHEGTQTALGDEVIKSLVKDNKEYSTKFLALSGTPFNILSEFEDNAIYTWDYIMEQENKNNWTEQYFGDSNPYDELPTLRIYTYDLGKIISENKYVSIEDKAFNFHEFFRTWTGNYKYDFASMPEEVQVGDFVHEDDVWSFLNLMTKEDNSSYYPYSTKEYREIFKHTLWILPGVKEAKALSKLMKKHPVFGCGAFNVVNVAGDGDEEEKYEDALCKVRKAIQATGTGEYTITLSCGKLTTGVTVPEWTGVFMLAGSSSTSASNYLQTIFRVQSPANIDGKIKENGYVFDFAPDRTLKMVASAVAVSGKAGKTKNSDKIRLGKFLNYCPVIGINGSEMHEYNTNILLQQLKKAYAEKVVKNGFDDASLYNDELFKINDIDIEKFDKLKGIIGKSKPQKKVNDIPLNEQGLTDEEYEEEQELDRRKRGKKDELTPEEKARLEELKKKKQIRNNAISILRGISIRIPLLIYGADIDINEDISVEQLTDIVDDLSWEEFMPIGITKDIFKEFTKYYDQEVFVGAGRKIRNMAKEADTLEPTERVKKIAELFSYFKNPDKETVLTPWRVVNMHMSDTLGGYDFWDKEHKEQLEKPKFINKEHVTTDVFGKEDTKILEINSKTGLYLLYVTYSVYRHRLSENNIDEIPLDTKKKVWLDTVKDNIFVVCKTPMAKQITRRTILGYEEGILNAHYFDDLINIMKNKPKLFINKIQKASYWKKEGVVMKFDAIVGNPPYQVMDGGNGASAKPVYHFFVEQAKNINPSYISMIMPARWYSGGKGLDDFRDSMLNDSCIRELYDCLTPEDIFPNTNIRGGVCYFLWDKNYNNVRNLARVVTYEKGKVVADIMRSIKTDGLDMFVRDNKSNQILYKVLNHSNFNSISSFVSMRRPFGFGGYFINDEKFRKDDSNLNNPVVCYGKGKKIGYVEKSEITVHSEWIDSWKIYTPRANNIGTELNDDNLNSFIGKPNTICTESYIVVGIGLVNDRESCNNLSKYFKTKFVRYLHSIAKASQDATAKTYKFVPIQDFSSNSKIDWSKSVSDIDKQLYLEYNLDIEEQNNIERKIKDM